MSTKYCSHCGNIINSNAAICPICGCRVANTIIVNNSNLKNKWVSFFLCLFLGVFGGHKFYEGKILLGIIYLLTGGLLGIGCLIDFFTLLFKPNPYSV